MDPSIHVQISASGFEATASGWLGVATVVILSAMVIFVAPWVWRYALPRRSSKPPGRPPQETLPGPDSQEAHRRPPSRPALPDSEKQKARQ